MLFRSHATHLGDSLGVAPGDCVAIEDSETGCRSAESAGCTVLAVPHHVAVEPGERRVFAETLVGVGPGDLASLLLPA